MQLKPILFSTPMVNAILSGNKSMTRRVVKPNPETQMYDVKMGYWSEYPADLKHPYVKCPYGQAGDILWVRETWANEYGGGVLYKASHSHVAPDGKWRPSIFMPRKACRIWLEITDVKVERVQDISEEDAMKEGVKPAPLPDLGNTWRTHKQGFEYLWHSINGAASWEANPFVWCISFKRIDKPENF